MNDLTAQTLKPCPFCGKSLSERDGMLFHREADTRDGACILAGLGIAMVHSKWGTEQVSAWNTRAPDPSMAARLEKAEALAEAVEASGVYAGMDLGAALSAYRGEA